MAGIKLLNEVCKPDQRHSAFVHINLNSGETRPYELADLYSEVAAIMIKGKPPKEIVEQFDKARNLVIYAWYVYDFGMLAMLQAHSTVEYALREKFKAEGIPKNCRTGLKKLLEYALKRGWIVDGGFSHIAVMPEQRVKPGFLNSVSEPLDPTGTRYCRILIDTMPNLRNNLAHGSSELLPPGYALRDLEICARIIDQLFPSISE